MSLSVLILGLNYAPEPTGIAPYTTGIARFLADAGHDVHVVTGLPHYPHWEIAAGYRSARGLLHERDGNVRVTRVAHAVPADPTGAGRIRMEASFASRAARAHHGTRPDVVLAVSPALLTVGAALRWRAPGRTAVGVVTQDLYGRAIAETGALGGRGAQAAATLERTLLRRADGVVAIHESFRRSLGELGVDDRPHHHHPQLEPHPPGALERAETCSPCAAGSGGATTRSSRCTPATWAPSRAWRTSSRPPGSPTPPARPCGSCCSAPATSGPASSASAPGSSACSSSTRCPRPTSSSPWPPPTSSS